MITGMSKVTVADEPQLPNLMWEGGMGSFQAQDPRKRRQTCLLYMIPFRVIRRYRVRYVSVFGELYIAWSAQWTISMKICR